LSVIYGNPRDRRQHGIEIEVIQLSSARTEA
jgi:hypothetical protein